MPTYVLGAGDCRAVAPVALELSLHGAGAGDCRFMLLRGDAPAPDGELKVTRGTTILTRPSDLPAQSVLRLVPRNGDSFPLDCLVEVVLASTQRAADPVALRLQLAPSGLPRLDLLELAWSTDGLVLTALKAGPPPPRRPIAKRAYEVSRMILGGVDAGGRGVDAIVVLDPSPSMDHWWQVGAVPAAVEVLAGLDHAVGRSEGIEIRVGGVGVVRSFAADEAASGALAMLDGAAPEACTALQSSRDAGGRISVVVTDLPQVAAETSAGIVHLVLCDPEVASILTGGPRMVPMTWRLNEDIDQWLADTAFVDLVKRLLAAISLDDSEESEQ